MGVVVQSVWTSFVKVLVIGSYVLHATTVQTYPRESSRHFRFLRRGQEGTKKNRPSKQSSSRLAWLPLVMLRSSRSSSASITRSKSSLGSQSRSFLSCATSTVTSSNVPASGSDKVILILHKKILVIQTHNYEEIFCSFLRLRQ